MRTYTKEINCKVLVVGKVYPNKVSVGFCISSTKLREVSPCHSQGHFSRQTRLEKETLKSRLKKVS